MSQHNGGSMAAKEYGLATKQTELYDVPIKKCKASRQIINKCKISKVRRGFINGNIKNQYPNIHTKIPYTNIQSHHIRAEPSRWKTYNAVVK